MHDGERAEVEPRERTSIVEIAFERHDAALSQLAHDVADARDADEAHAMPQQFGDAQRHVAASHEQHTLHHDVAD
jgi:hypothetical protein